MNRFLLGGFLGALLGVLFAPANGRTTRAKIREKATKYNNDLNLYVEKKSKHLGNKLQGLNHQLSKFSDEAKDKSLVFRQQAAEKSQKFRTQMGEKAQELRGRMEQFRQETMEKAGRLTDQDFTPPSKQSQPMKNPEINTGT